MKAGDALTRKIIGAAINVHCTLGPGFLESVYEISLSIELRSLRLAFVCQHAIPVHYQGELVGDFIADLVVESSLLIEIKSVRSVNPRHEAQLVNYLKATGIETGLLLNFGGDRLEFKKKFKTYRASENQPIL